MKRTLCGVVILTVLVWWQSTDAFLDAFRVIGAGPAVAALAIGVLTTVLSAARWSLVARGLGLRLPMTTAVADYYRALFLNAVLPAGVLGDVHRAVSHGRDEGDVRRSVRAVVLERAAGQAVLIVVALAVMLSAGGVVPGRAVGAVLLCVLAAAAALAVVSRSVWPGVVLLSAATLAGYVALFVVAGRLAGVTAPITDLVPLALVALVVMALPVNVGGWGPREAASTLAFGTAGLGASQGLTVAVVYGVLALIASLPGAAVLLLARRRAGVPVQEGEVLAERPDQAREKVLALAGRGQ
ncbi:lysylphosphatidylglycerol synthase transmembrane domain-containing protein [Actinomadura fulvescens]|uniref:Lysylphosphatidylglycerol synthase transmembrane domain-containing protein n=1 Tax=Actinomadura fulvescens TaxID=46160 RepID=A0ABN3PP71_9ACTN